jgi:hypothetical protein
LHLYSSLKLFFQFSFLLLKCFFGDSLAKQLLNNQVAIILDLIPYLLTKNDLVI